jgi:hypothetical protein
MAFVVIAAAGITGSAWLLVLGFAAHGLKDAWQTTGPVCVRHPVVASVLRRCRLVVALAIAIEIVAGIRFQP